MDAGFGQVADESKAPIRVVENGSFSAVARELGVGQPAVSKQITFYFSVSSERIVELVIVHNKLA